MVHLLLILSLLILQQFVFYQHQLDQLKLDYFWFYEKEFQLFFLFLNLYQYKDLICLLQLSKLILYNILINILIILQHFQNPFFYYMFSIFLKMNILDNYLFNNIQQIQHLHKELIIYV